VYIFESELVKNKIKRVQFRVPSATKK